MIEIRQLNPREPFPWKLLYTADPSREAVADYTARGVCFGAWESGKIIGVSVLLRTRPFTMELVNLAVEESCQGRGVGKRLIRHAVETARNAGCTVLEVGTGNSRNWPSTNAADSRSIRSTKIFSADTTVKKSSKTASSAGT